MTGLEALKNMCETCERNLASRHQRCPFRSITSDYCEEYDKISEELKKPQEFYNKIKILRDNARLTRDEHEKKQDLNHGENIGISAAIVTYNNILTIMENMFNIFLIELIKEDAKHGK